MKPVPVSEVLSRSTLALVVAGALLCGFVGGAGAGEVEGTAEAPTGVEARGRLQVPEDVPAPRELSFELTPCGPIAEEEIAGEENESIDRRAAEDRRGACPIADGAFTCRLSAGCWHLRLVANGFVPVDLFDLKAIAGEPVDLGRLTLRHGGAVSGRIGFASGTAPADLAQARLELMPLVPSAVTREEHERRTAFSRRARVDAAGAFRLTGLPTGRYRLVARLGELEARSPIVGVETGAETLLDPLLLAPPLRLEVVLDPPHDPWQKPWRLTVHSAFGALAPGEGPVAHAEEAVDGRWTSGPIAPGWYDLRLQSSRGGTFAETSTAVESGLETLDWSLDLVPVEGEVRLGAEPLPSRLIFHDRNAVSVPLDADEDGAFAGLLPGEGEWSVNVRSPDHEVNERLTGVEVEVGPSGVAKLDFRLPDTRLEGRVVGPGGDPEARAVVTVRRDPSGGPVSTRTDEAGRFRLRGLAVADYWAKAEKSDLHGRLQSDLTFVSLGEERETALHLELRRERKISGRVLVPDGAPLSGARITVDPQATTGARFFTAPLTVTGSDGYFEVSMPAEAESVLISVKAPGIGWRVWPLPAAGPWPVDLVLDGPTGTLTLHLRQGAVPVTHPGRSPVLYHPTGFGIGQGDVIQWANLHTDGPLVWPAERTRWELPLLQPGVYTACWVTREEFAAVDRGERPARLCTAGTLAANGRLELTLPPSGGDG